MNGGWTERIPNVTPKDSTNNNNMSDVIGNKTDGHDGNSAMSFLHIINEHLHNIVFIRPSLAGSVTLTSGAGAWAAYPTPTQIIAANNITEDFDLHFLDISDISANGEYQIALYTGAALSEVLVGEFGAVRNAVQSQEGARNILTPLFDANTRISAALSSSNAGANTINIKLEGHKY